MKISRKLAIAAGIGAALSLALTGCSTGGSSTSGGKTEVSFLTFTSPNLTKSFWENAAASVEKANPDITVKLLYTPTLDRQAYAKQLLASGQLPDVIWDAPLTDFVKAKALLAYPSSAYTKLNVPSGYGAIDGKQYNLSAGAFMMNGLYYNPDAFTAAGVDIPTTYDELTAAAVKLKAAGYTPFLIQSASDAWSDEYLLDSFVDGTVIKDNPDWLKERKAGKVKFDSADFRKAVQQFVDLRDAKLFNDDALSINYSQSTAAWATGKYAMWPMGGWAAAIKTTGFTSSVFPTPTEDGSKVLAVAQGASLYVSASTKHPTAAQKVAIAFSTSELLGKAQMKSDGQFPVLKKTFTPPSGTTEATLAGLKLDADSSYSKVWPFPTTVSGDDAPPSGWGAEYNKAIQTLLGGGSVSDFVTTLDSKWDALNK